MRKVLKLLFAPAALAMVAGAGIATTAAPANADVYFSFGTPFYTTPYYYAPPAYYYAPACHWDPWYGRVCY